LIRAPRSGSIEVAVLVQPPPGAAT